MLVQIIDKQRRAVSVVHAALSGAGIHGRSVCVTTDTWLRDYNRCVTYAVFVSAPVGTAIEPYYETGKPL